MFVDIVSVPIAAGDGGNGLVSFRHEKFVDKGGPDGGDGGRGGNIVFKATRNENTLAAFRYQKQLQAEHGLPGGRRKKHGRSGKDLIIKVPVGTSIINETTGSMLADLTEDEQAAVIANGGQGGYGNAHFTSSTRQAPKIAEKGEKGEQLTVTLEMKLVADVGLIGLPNAGKSSLLGVVSNAKPEIADYPFTTTVPNLGVVDTDDRSLLVADIPGLIEGASQGKGLGDEFLRHVSRCKVLLHLIDVTSDDIVRSYNLVRNELAIHSHELVDKPQIVVLTKSELVDQDIIAMQTELLSPALQAHETIIPISAHAHTGVKELMHQAARYVITADKLAEQQAEQAGLPVITLKPDKNAWVAVRMTDGSFLVTGSKIESFAKRTDYANEQGIMRLRDIMRKMGITNQLLALGIEEGTTIRIGDPACGEIEF